MPATVSGASRFYLKHPTLHHRSRSKAVGIVAAAMARIEAGPRALGIANRIGAAIAKHDPLHPLKSHQQALYPVGHGSTVFIHVVGQPRRRVPIVPYICSKSRKKASIFSTCCRALIK